MVLGLRRPRHYFTYTYVHSLIDCVMKIINLLVLDLSFALGAYVKLERNHDHSISLLD